MVTVKRPKIRDTQAGNGRMQRTSQRETHRYDIWRGGSVTAGLQSTVGAGRCATGHEGGGRCLGACTGRWRPRARICLCVNDWSGGCSRGRGPGGGGPAAANGTQSDNQMAGKITLYGLQSKTYNIYLHNCREVRTREALDATGRQSRQGRNQNAHARTSQPPSIRGYHVIVKH